MHGLLLVDKPKGLTSHDVVARVRRILKIKRVGHFGTLDPMATGLLVVAVERATRLFPFFLKVPKAYEGQIRLGFPTDTYDAEGKPLSAPCLNLPDRESLIRAMKALEGRINQTSPPFSAKKLRGRRMYELAREGKEVERRVSSVEVYAFQLKAYHPPFVAFTAECSSGTYIRSLAHDLGQRLGCGAHLSALRRTAVGDFRIQDACKLEELENQVRSGNIGARLVPIENLFLDYPSLIIRRECVSLVKDGNDIGPRAVLRALPPEKPVSCLQQKEEGLVRILDPNGHLLAMARKIPAKPSYHPFLLLDIPPRGT